MINVSDEVKALFKADNVHKEIEVRFPGVGITLHNEDLITESLTLKESIEDEDNLSFTGCIASCLSFECFDFVTDVRGRRIEVDMLVEDNKIPLFRGYVDEVSNLTHEDFTRQITAYDVLYMINNADVTAWWNSLTFPISCKALRNSFFNQFAIEQVEDYLPNDTMLIYKNIEDKVISGATIIKNICQINGRFGQINRYGKFIYRRLITGTEALYPREDLFPDDELFPTDENASDSVSKAHYISINYENFEVEPITGIRIIGKDDSVIASIGTNANVLTISGNPLFYGLSANELSGAVQNIFNTVRNLWYVPSEIVSVGLPYVECGDFILCATRRSIVRSYVLSRTLRGIQVLEDSFISQGDFEQPEYVSSAESTTNAALSQEIERAAEAEKNIDNKVSQEIQSRIEAINGCYSQITQTANQIRSEVSNADNSIYSTISQTASSIRSEVADTTRGLSSRIEQNAASITLQAQTINLKADRTYVDNLIATRATVASLNAVNAKFDNINANNIKSGTLSVDRLSTPAGTPSWVPARIGNLNYWLLGKIVT